MKNKTRKGANSSYFGDILESIKTLSEGLWLTLKHIFQATKRRDSSYVSDKNYFDQKTGLVTLQYPYESIPVPDNGRYRLHNEIDDCIVCDKCAKICPVDCITIESIKATEEIGKTSDGTSKRLYAPTFDIDLAKCCYCGLCTTVCPTECLTMTKAYDFSEVDVGNFIYKFADMTWEEAEQKRKEIEAVNAQKEAAKAAAKAAAIEEKVEGETIQEAKPAGAKPAFKPKIRSANPANSPTNPTDEDITNSAQGTENTAKQEKPTVAKPVFKPKIRPVITEAQTKQPDENADISPESNTTTSSESKPAAPRPVFKPKIRPNASVENTEKSIAPVENTAEEKKSQDDEAAEEKKPAAAKPIFRPKIRPIKPQGGKTEE
ncbi:MAG TPA: 4Fe-4S dicluster domain-containing protein [Cytophagales bacterium]|nr:4Fe-4S dicluster domain-containing protein [Cytophagales bacterium]